MSKITFRADDDLVEELEGLETSKSEAMREALRAYLEGEDGAAVGGERSERDGEGAIEELVRELVDERLATRLRELGIEQPNSRAHESRSAEPRDVSVSISLEGATVRSDEGIRVDDERTGETPPADGQQPGRAHQRSQTQGSRDARADEETVQCTQCGDHLEGDHVYCPNCGEKASRRLFCDCGDEIRSDWSFCPGCGRRTPAADVLESDTGHY
ncbi:double zinc ribbon domain-containing protein [Natrinema longum]|uniref:CopG family transcriptional regulator n=1 Tax=Natrinema longum TaxID=370324 RepID=A0A8A2U6L8_9EURY|nr:zinc ribbon domain-containing protein [Natrinema longum]MBZ6494337.1 CopG family transcriptional regulator [Natrinema longum]QSW84340.1 CopG family transcriptional regulator [Natrinema longum]